MLLNDPAALSSVGVWALNIFSSVGLVMANKAVMVFFEFRYATTLTALHFTVTACSGLLAKYWGYLSPKTIPLHEVVWFSIAADVSVVTSNLSLMLNSVGFYQIAKLSIIPTVSVFEAILNGKTFSNEVKLSMLVVMIGVGICTVTDVAVNFYGLMSAAAAVLSTSLQQIFVGTLHKKHNIGSFDLLSQTAPLQAVTLVALGPLIDYLLTKNNVFTYPLTLGGVSFILVSCVLAIFVNLSTYLCIGKFSAVSFQVLGHMKTVLVLALGWLLFDSPLSLKNVAGMAIAVGGMVMYSRAVENDKAELVAQVSKAHELQEKRRQGDEKPLLVEEDKEIEAGDLEKNATAQQKS